MPTLAGLGLDQSLRDTLAGGGTGRGGDNPQQQQQHLPIKTPQSLLARDPTTLAAGLSLSLPDVLNLRAAVADALTASSDVGRKSATVVGDASRSILATVQQEQVEGTLTDGTRTSSRKRPRPDGNNDDERAPDISATIKSQLFHRNRPPPVVVGAVTALDLCIHSSTLAEKSGCGGSIGTGSSCLDGLLSPDTGLIEGGPSTRIYKSLIMPPMGGSTNSNAGVATDVFGPRPDQDPHHQTTAQQHGGIRLGYVTEVYGPSASGKTQLALTAAANAAIKGWNVHYIAGGGGSSSIMPLARRLRTLVLCRIATPSSSSSSGPSSARRSGRKGSERHALERVEFVTVSDGHEALAALADIHKDIMTVATDNSTTSAVTNNLVILDSASGCLSSDLYADGDGGVGAALVEDVSFALRKVARATGSDGTRRSRCAVLAVNGSVSGDYGHKAALGMSWRAADVQIRFDVLQDADSGQQHQVQQIPGLSVDKRKVISVTLTKHHACSTGAATSISITANGIGDK